MQLTPVWSWGELSYSGNTEGCANPKAACAGKRKATMTQLSLCMLDYTRLHLFGGHKMFCTQSPVATVTCKLGMLLCYQPWNPRPGSGASTQQRYLLHFHQPFLAAEQDAQEQYCSSKAFTSRHNLFQPQYSVVRHCWCCLLAECGHLRFSLQYCEAVQVLQEAFPGASLSDPSLR